MQYADDIRRNVVSKALFIKVRNDAILIQQLCSKCCPIIYNILLRECSKLFFSNALSVIIYRLSLAKAYASVKLNALKGIFYFFFNFICVHARNSISFLSTLIRPCTKSEHTTTPRRHRFTFVCHFGSKYTRMDALVSPPFALTFGLSRHIISSLTSSLRVENRREFTLAGVAEWQTRRT